MAFEAWSRGSADTFRVVAVVGAAVAAVLYLLVGLEVLPVGTTTTGEATDSFGFGAVTGGTFAVVALLLMRFRSRVLWAAVAVLQVITLVGYVAAAGIRSPSYEVWGIAIKVVQVVILVAVAWLLLRAGSQPGRQHR